MDTDKNRCYRRSRIAEPTFRRLIKAFAMDLAATDAAELTGLSVRSANNIYLKIRRRIAEHCEAQSPFPGEVEIDESLVTGIVNEALRQPIESRRPVAPG